MQLAFPLRTSTLSAPAPTRTPMQVVGLFAGIGGMELGLSRAGHETRLLCEIDPGARAVLNARLPGIRVHDDVTTLDRLPRSTQLLTAGFPCQDLSQAGKTVGIGGMRSGLVGEIFRLLQTRPVPWVLLENVPFMLQLERGRAMNVLVTEFERLGYRWAYRVVNSRAFGLPQRRERVLFLASRKDDPRAVLLADDTDDVPDPADPIGRLACGFYWTEGVRGLGWAVDAVPTLKGGSTVGIPSPPAIVMPSREIVTPDIRDTERMQGFEPDWTLPATSVARASHRWKLVGNAVTVNVFEWVGHRLCNPSSAGALAARWPLKADERWPRAAWNVGEGRFGAHVSAHPVRRERAPLHDWLAFSPAPLSRKATAGFLARTESSSLRFPKGFIDAVRKHLQRRSGDPLPARPAKSRRAARITPAVLTEVSP